MTHEADPAIRLRAYRSSDLEDIFALDVICFDPPFSFSLEMMRHCAEARQALTVIAERDADSQTNDAESGGRIVGFCIAHVEGRRESDRVAYIVTLDVEPGGRRRGLARRLMEEIDTQARAVGCRSLVLHVSVENEGAIRFYERMGFVRTHVAGGFYGGRRDAFVYRRLLGASPANGGE